MIFKKIITLKIPSEYLQNNSDLKTGDILIAINEKKVSSLQDIRLELLSLSGINKNGNLTTTIMNKEEDSIAFLYDNGSKKKSYSIPPRSIITITND